MSLPEKQHSIAIPISFDMTTLLPAPTMSTTTEVLKGPASSDTISPDTKASTTVSVSEVSLAQPAFKIVTIKKPDGTLVKVKRPIPAADVKTVASPAPVSAPIVPPAITEVPVEASKSKKQIAGTPQTPAPSTSRDIPIDPTIAPVSSPSTNDAPAPSDETAAPSVGAVYSTEIPKAFDPAVDGPNASYVQAMASKPAPTSTPDQVSQAQVPATALSVAPAAATATAPTAGPAASPIAPSVVSTSTAVPVPTARPHRDWGKTLSKSFTVVSGAVQNMDVGKIAEGLGKVTTDIARLADVVDNVSQQATLIAHGDFDKAAEVAKALTPAPAAPAAATPAASTSKDISAPAATPATPAKPVAKAVAKPAAATIFPAGVVYLQQADGSIVQVPMTVTQASTTGSPSTASAAAQATTAVAPAPQGPSNVFYVQRADGTLAMVQASSTPIAAAISSSGVVAPVAPAAPRPAINRTFAPTPAPTPTPAAAAPQSTPEAKAAGAAATGVAGIGGVAALAAPSLSSGSHSGTSSTGTSQTASGTTQDARDAQINDDTATDTADIASTVDPNEQIEEWDPSVHGNLEEYDGEEVYAGSDDDVVDYDPAVHGDLEEYSGEEVYADPEGEVEEYDPQIHGDMVEEGEDGAIEEYNPDVHGGLEEVEEEQDGEYEAQPVVVPEEEGEAEYAEEEYDAGGVYEEDDY